MFRARYSAATFLFLSSTSLALAPRAQSQHFKPRITRATLSTFRCAGDRADTPNWREGLDAGHDLLAPRPVCSEDAALPNNIPAPIPASFPASRPDDPKLLPGADDPVDTELLAGGARSAAIAEAHGVLDILGQPNACSNWFRSKEPDVAELFRSLEFRIDDGGDTFVEKIVLPNGDWLFLQPYAARSRQNVGPGSTITVNAHGAFFAKAAVVLRIYPQGGPTNAEPSRILHVGGYFGGSLAARELTLLHELGHIIDLLPIDAGIPGGPALSTRNTGEVVRHCAAEIGKTLGASKKRY